MFKLKIIVAAIVLCLNAATAQTKVINLWQNEIPGSKDNSSYKAVIDSNQGWTWEKYISNPVIDFYPSPAEKSNGTAVKW